MSLVAALATVALLGCSGGTAEVAGVTVEVPRGWQDATAPERSQEVEAAASWQGGQDGASTLQVVVGCGPGTVQDLAVAAITEPRPPLEVTAADEVGEVEIPGADEALELRFTLGAGRDDDATSLRVAGVYAAVEDTLVLVEISTPVRDTQRELIDATLTSVQLDAEELASRCR